MSALEEFAHTVQPTADEVFTHFMRNSAPEPAVRDALLAAFELGRTFERVSICRSLAQQQFGVEVTEDA